MKRKSGNIDDFCRRWGNQYSYMVVLDADSVMSGECLSGLVRLMEANPNAGIIQSSPKASGMDTLYARCQQFATRVYGPLFTAGLHFWQLGESHYWGHNAIIRVKPFIEHCALAPLPGEGSFAGSILSHDFVEAALMRRAGWGVWIAYDLPGSYEELPPNLLDELKRDRRWCHGNLMNFRLFLVKGMHPVHRAVFLTGVMSYLSAPLWFMFLALSTALQVVHALTEPQYFLQPRQLFPVWPQWRPELAIALFASTMVLLFLPKLLSIMLIWCKGTKEYGGSGALRCRCCWKCCSPCCWRRCVCCFIPCLWSARSSAGKWSGTHRNATMILRRGEKPLCVTALNCCWGWSGRWVWRGWIYAFCSGWRRLSFADSVAIVR